VFPAAGMGRPLEEDEGGFGDGGESSGREMSLLEFLAEGMDKATQVQTTFTQPSLQ